MTKSPKHLLLVHSEFWSFEIASDFACLRAAASAKAGISRFGFSMHIRRFKARNHPDVNHYGTPITSIPSFIRRAAVTPGPGFTFPRHTMLPLPQEGLFSFK